MHLYLVTEVDSKVELKACFDDVALAAKAADALQLRVLVNHTVYPIRDLLDRLTSLNDQDIRYKLLR